VKRILVTGRNGQVGWELERALAPLGDVLACDRTRIDLAMADDIRTAVREAKPDIIVNAAAYTAVDKAEVEPELAMTINGTAPGILAEEARRHGALLVHYSTDYVFDGSKPTAYTEDDLPSPINSYGRSKLAGEHAIRASGCRHLILRTSWVYGLRGRNFLRTMMRLAAERDELRVVDDQIGAPTWSRMIAQATALALAAAEPLEGLFHLASAGKTSWFGFTEAILASIRDQHVRMPRLTPISTNEYPLPAARPANSRLDCGRLMREAAISLPHWQAALHLCLQDMGTDQ
jgi:dTDP-4-dehydrorhamnose reductase